AVSVRASAVRGRVMTEAVRAKRRLQRGGVAATGDSAAGAVDPARQMLSAMQAVAQGDFNVELPGHWDGLEGRLADAFNQVVRGNRALASELARVGQKVGREGLTRQRIALPSRHGCWGDMEDSVNELVDDLVRPVATITEAIAGVA